MMVSLTNSWPNIVSQQSLRSSSRVVGSSVGLGVVVVVVVVISSSLDKLNDKKANSDDTNENRRVH